MLYLDPGRLRIVYAIAFCTGIAAIFFGYRRSRMLLGDPWDPLRRKRDSNPEIPAASPAAASTDSMPQVIRLSLPPVATRSTEMSQQQKVAAALIRAGVANPLGWTESTPQAEDTTSKLQSSSSSA